MITIKLDCDFIMKPRILLNDKNLTRTDTDILGLIISLAIRNNYCYATNKYLSDYINVSERTICYSIKKFKELNYIFIERVDGKRRIYINKDVVPMTRASAKSCTMDVQRVAVSKRKGLHKEGATDCTHNIYNKYKKRI